MLDPRTARRLTKALLTLFAALCVAFIETNATPPEERSETSDVRVVDGDTIEVRGEDGVRTKVRLIGIDAPESVDPRRPVECFGREAAKKLRELLEGKQVTLVSDPSQDDTDRYGRALRYVEVEGADAGLALLTRGYAHEYTHRRAYARQAEYREAMAEAKRSGTGLWAPGACAPEVAQ